MFIDSISATTADMPGMSLRGSLRGNLFSGSPLWTGRSLICLKNDIKYHSIFVEGQRALQTQNPLQHRDEDKLRLQQGGLYDFLAIERSLLQVEKQQGMAEDKVMPNFSLAILPPSFYDSKEKPTQ